MKSKLLEHYGKSIFIAEGEGLSHIVSFREKMSEILRKYFNTPNVDDEETEKRAIIEAAAKLIKSDIKTMITPSVEEYPKSNDVTLECALEYVPASVRCLLQHLLVGKDTRKQEPSSGHISVQGVRPRVAIAPLQIGLAIQMHHHFRSKFLVDILSAMGYCSSYSEVQRFEENAASSIAPDVLDGLHKPDKMVLFAAENVDHNIVTLGGKGTFHGMGRLAAVTPGNKVTHTVLRRKLSDLNTIDQTKVDIVEHRFAREALSSVKFQPLPILADVAHNIDILREMSFLFAQAVPNWQGMMHVLHTDCEYPGQSTIAFLPMVDMYPAYLYLQNMVTLEADNPAVFQKFVNGFHVIRRSEQTLMWSLKSTWGLTRGSGMSEQQRPVWTMSAPVSSAYNYAMQEFGETVYTTSDQHNDPSAPRMARDKEDLAKLAAKLDQQSPFSGEVVLRNTITGINAGTNVNVQNLFIVGKDAVTNMEGQAVFSYAHKRTNAAKTLASTIADTVNKERGIAPALLF